jgi:hypothetical protein
VANFINDEEDLEGLVQSIRESQDSEKVKNIDDLVLFDYSEKSDEKTPEQKNLEKKQTHFSIQAAASAPISHSVAEAIKRELDKRDNREKTVRKQTGPIKDPSPSPSPLPLPEEDTDKYLISAESVDRKTIEPLVGFQVIPQYNKNEGYTDYSNGVVEIEKKRNESGVLRFTLLKHGHARTIFELNIQEENNEINVPVLSHDWIDQLIEKNGLEGYGGFYLVEMGDQMEDVDIDGKYEYRLYLDDQFKTVGADQAKFILFVGINPGNVLVKYLLNTGKTMERINLITPDEIFYDRVLINRKEKISFELFQKHSLSSILAPLNISGEDIGLFNSDISSEKATLNKYVINVPARPKGMTNYLELKHLDDSLFIGHTGQGKIVAPSEEFISEVLGAYELNDLDKQCIVQINFENSPEELILDGEYSDGYMGYRVLYLDKDGVFTDEISPLTTMAFILGDQQGMFFGKVTSGSGTKYFQSFCSDGTYLVEHF